ncbi:hypothetical protein N431DRAFT_94477 [Stipitochalara longipes BDJ]|nr:hypothetical protein N431DRAFT_94477 [Stipitochalara longipes BDJ]
MSSRDHFKLALVSYWEKLANTPDCLPTVLQIWMILVEANLRNTSQIEDPNLCLQAIADPPSHHHHHQRHHHLSHVLFPGWDWDAHHRHEEHPHFYEMRMQWEKIRDGIPRAFAEMDIQAALQERIRKTRKKEEDKLKDDKKKLKDKLDGIEKEEKQELDDTKKENKKELMKLEEHNEERLLEQERIEHKRDLAVERFVETKLEDEPIDQMDKLAHVVGHIQRVFTPRTSHETIQPIRFNVNSSALASGYGMGAGGRGGRVGSASLEVVIFDDHHHDTNSSLLNTVYIDPFQF